RASATGALVAGVNAMEGRYTPYRATASAPAGAAPEASAVAAAYGALVRLYPDQRSALDQAYAKSLGRIADGAAKTAGIAVGETVAARVVALRAGDGPIAPNLYPPRTSPRVYVV